MGSIGAFAALLSSCLSTTGITGGAPEEENTDAGEQVDTAAPDPNPCGKDLQTDAVNCGTCGKVCAFGVNSFPRCEAGACTIGCNSGFANCDGDNANGCETNLQNDAANCAACGRGCLGGTCAIGVCQPTVIGTVQARLAGITVDATHVFYGTNGAVAGASGITRIEKDGKNALAIVSNVARTIYTITSDGSFVYFPQTNLAAAPAADGSILKVAKDGKTAPQAVVSGQPIQSTVNLSITSDFAYWSNYGVYDSVSTTYNGSVMRCALPAGCGSAPSSLAGSQSGVYGLTLDSTSVYFGVYGYNAGVANSNVYKCPLAGCGAQAPTKLSPTNQLAYWMTADATNVYWGTSDAVVKSDKAKVDALPLSSGLKSPRALVVDAKNVYWVSSSGGVVQSCAVGGCNSTPTNLASNLACPSYLAQDDDALYWTTGCSTSGTVMKVRK